jgi:hypothetical protein
LKKKIKLIFFEKFEELKKNNEIKDKKINELENKISIILKEMDEKNKRIESLEKDINEIKKNFDKFKQEINQNISKAKSKLTNPIFDNILKNSNIFQDEEDIQLLLNNISNNNVKDLKLLYNSKVDGENEEKLINTYTEKNDLIILVKTDKSKRFGGYAHESFEKNNFKKSDINAFLFNLDKKKIYKSKGKEFSIWRGYNTSNSINFGTGTDLKIFHKFLSEQNNTFQDNHDYNYKNEYYALNGEENFGISFLEIYQVLKK